MRYLVMMFAVLALTAFAACNDSAEQSADSGASGAGADSHAGHDHGEHDGHDHSSDEGSDETSVVSDYEPLAGTDLALASGESIHVVSVSKFDRNIKDLSGKVAIEGVVREAYPDRDAFMMMDVGNMTDCTENCCPQTKFPVRVSMDSYDGELPAVGDFVIVVGDLTLGEADGYTFEVTEVQRDGAVLMQKMESASG